MERAAYNALISNLEAWTSFRADRQTVDFASADFPGSTKLDGYDLSGCSFKFCSLTQASMVGATLNKASFQKANLYLANLTNAQGAGVDFTNCNLKGAILSGTKLTNCTFHTVTFVGSIEGCDFSGSKFQNCTFADLTIINCVFDGCEFDNLTAPKLTAKRSRFQSAAFRTAALHDSNFEDMSFAQATFSNLNFNNITATSTIKGGPPLECAGATFTGNTSFIKAELAGACFMGAKFTGGTMQGAQLAGADFSRANLVSLVLSDARGEGAIFKEVVSSGVTAPAAHFQKADFRKASLRNANFSHAKLQDSLFEEADLTESSFQLADLSQADMRQASLVNAVLSGAIVRGTRITRFDFDDLRIHDYFGLRENQVRGMSIEDDFARARMFFSGFWSWYHSLVTVVWLLPLMWIGLRSFLLSFMPKTVVSYVSVDISLGNQLWGYVRSGKMYARAISESPFWTYDFNITHFTTFMLMALYNGIRVYMLYIVKRNELSYTVSGLLPVYMDEGKNWWLLRTVKYGAYVYSFFTLTHVIRFLGQEYPAIVR